MDNKKFKLVQLIEYHDEIKNSLEYDLNKNIAGYSDQLTNDLMKRYKLSDWRYAYKKAIEYHDGKLTEYLYEFEKTYPNQDWLESYYRFETEIQIHVDRNTRLGKDLNKFLKLGDC